MHFSHFIKIVNLKFPELIPTYLDNITRLGLTEIPYDTYMTAENTYEPLENDEVLTNIKIQIEKVNQKVHFERKIVKLTLFGKLFINNVVSEKN